MKTCPICQQEYADDAESCPRDGSRLAAEARDERECPYCAERILRKARVCKHCGRDVEPLAGTGIATQAPPPAPPQTIVEPPTAHAQGNEPMALESELGKRGLGNASIAEDKKEEVSRPHETAKHMPGPRKHRGLWILAWFLALFIYNVASHWSQNADKSGLYIFVEALQRLTTPEMLALSAVVVYAILSIGRTKQAAPDLPVKGIIYTESEMEEFKRRRLSADSGSHLAAQPEPQREAAKPQPQATAVPVPKTSVPATVRDTVATKAVSQIAHPSRRNWLVVTVVIALILVGGGTWYFLQHRVKKSEVKVNPKDGLKYVRIPPGSFKMGCSPRDTECSVDESPPHRVTITKGFWLGQTEVTVGAYKRFVAVRGWQMPPELGEHDKTHINPGWVDEAMPIFNVSWGEAHSYCEWAGGRLPTEAEWEYAARAGSTEAHYGPLDEVAWYYDNSGLKPHEVAQKRANGFGLYDMLGNVWEWVNDQHDNDYYKNSPSQDPMGPASGGWYELRGGAWMDSSTTVRVSRRYSFSPDFKDNFVGFRCAMELANP